MLNLSKIAGTYRYFSTASKLASRKPANIFTTNHSDFESLLDKSIGAFKEYKLRKDVIESIRSDFHSRVAYLSENEGASVALDLASKYEAFTRSLDLAMNVELDKERENQKTLKINLVGTNLQLITLYRDLNDLKNSKILSSFLCYKNFPLAFSSNAIYPASNRKNYNIHHFALGEIPEKLSAEENLLFGDKLLMSLTQYYLPLFIDEDLKSQRISCRSNRSIVVQKEMSLSCEDLKESSDPFRSDFKIIHDLSENTLREIIFDITKMRPSQQNPSIRAESDFDLPAPKYYFTVRGVVSLCGNAGERS